MMLSTAILALLILGINGELDYSSVPVKANWELSSLITKIWNADNNRLTFGRDIRLSYQNQASWNYARDVSTQPLFYTLNTNIFSKPTFKAFLALLDNYEMDPSVHEDVSNQEITENYRFLDEVLKTPAMKLVHDYLKRKGKASFSISQFKSELYDLWFKKYYRSSVRGSSGFEHVFVGEIKSADRVVSGFHSWIQFYLEEKKKHLNYYGYLKRGSSPYLSLIKYSWNNNLKHVGSAFFGTSPEFEFALYSLVYMAGYEKLQFSLDNMPVMVTCFGINRNRNIGTCYPDFA